MRPTKEEVQNAISILKSFDLKTVSYDDVRRQTDVLVMTGFFGAELPNHHYPIYRAVPTNPEKVQKHISEISYAPIDKQPQFNRASSNKHQIFYGAVMPEAKKLDEITAAIEVSGITSDSFADDKDVYLAIGQWFTKVDIMPIAILGIHSKLAENNKDAIVMRKVFGEIVEKFRHEGGDAADLAAKYMSDEFEKKVGEGENWNYKITAAYGDKLFESGFGVITYPSVKAEGKAFNIAIHKDVVDKGLYINVAVISRLMKRNKQVVSDYWLQCPKINDDGLIRWNDVPFGVRMSAPDVEYLLSKNE